MRIGAFSDSHGDISFAERFYDRISPLDIVIHLGDYASDGIKLGKLFSCPVFSVRGNCDYRSAEPLERQLNLSGKRFLLMHGHQYNSFINIMYHGEEVHADLVLYGHTHIPDLSADGHRLFLNLASKAVLLQSFSLFCRCVQQDASAFFSLD